MGFAARAEDAHACVVTPKSSLVVNVRDKGARGDGRTDDAGAIQAAIDEVGGTGGTVLVPRGVEHGYALRSATADLLVVLTPAGAETCLVDLHAGTPVERLVIAAAHHGIEITGPPPRVEKRK